MGTGSQGEASRLLRSEPGKPARCLKQTALLHELLSARAGGQCHVLPGQAPGGIAATHAAGLEGGWPRFPRQFRSRTLELVVPKVAARSSGAEEGCHPRSTPRFKYFSIRSGTGFVHMLPPFHISLVGRSRGMMHRCGEQNTHTSKSATFHVVCHVVAATAPRNSKSAQDIAVS